MGVRRDINPVYIWLSIFFSSPVDSPLLGGAGGVVISLNLKP